MKREQTRLRNLEEKRRLELIAEEEARKREEASRKVTRSIRKRGEMKARRKDELLKILEALNNDLAVAEGNQEVNKEKIFYDLQRVRIEKGTANDDAKKERDWKRANYKVNQDINDIQSAVTTAKEEYEKLMGSKEGKGKPIIKKKKIVKRGDESIRYKISTKQLKIPNEKMYEEISQRNREKFYGMGKYIANAVLKKVQYNDPSDYNFNPMPTKFTDHFDKVIKLVKKN